MAVLNFFEPAPHNICPHRKRQIHFTDYRSNRNRLLFLQMLERGAPPSGGCAVSGSAGADHKMPAALVSLKTL